MPFNLVFDVPALKMRVCLVTFYIVFFKRLGLKNSWAEFCSNGILYEITYNSVSPLLPQITDKKTFGGWMYTWLVLSEEDFKTKIMWTFFVTTTSDGNVQLPNEMSRDDLFFNSFATCFEHHFPSVIFTDEFFIEHAYDECLVITIVVDEKLTNPLYTVKLMTLGNYLESTQQP